MPGSECVAVLSNDHGRVSSVAVSQCGRAVITAGCKIKYIKKQEFCFLSLVVTQITRPSGDDCAVLWHMKLDTMMRSPFFFANFCK